MKNKVSLYLNCELNEHLSLLIESFAINLRGVSTKLYILTYISIHSLEANQARIEQTVK